MRENTVKGWLQLARPPVGALKWEKVEFAESVKLAIKSLEKQIPVKPDYQYAGEYGECTEYYCKSCGQYLSNTEDEDMKYCTSCGQAIDWNN